MAFGRPPFPEVLEAPLSTDPGGRARVVTEASIASAGVPLSELPPPVPFGAAWKVHRWHDYQAVTWKYADHIHLGEARAVVLWLETLSRVRAVRNSRILCMCDSQSATGALTKGRSRAYAFNRLMRKRTALEVTSLFTLLVGWVRSADQPADRLSRHRIVFGLMQAAWRTTR